MLVLYILTHHVKGKKVIFMILEFVRFLEIIQFKIGAG